MIKKLLAIIKEGKHHTIRAIADELEVSQDLVEQMMVDLVNKGYIKEQPQECSLTCGDCNVKQLCLHNEDLTSNPTIWVLNEHN